MKKNMMIAVAAVTTLTLAMGSTSLAYIPPMYEPDAEEYSLSITPEDITALDVAENYEITYSVSFGDAEPVFTYEFIKAEDGCFIKLGSEEITLEKQEDDLYLLTHYKNTQITMDRDGSWGLSMQGVSNRALQAIETPITLDEVLEHADEVLRYMDLYTEYDHLAVSGQEEINGVMCDRYVAKKDDDSQNNAVLWINPENGICYQYENADEDGVVTRVSCTSYETEEVTLPEA